jgi:hypothetical protein
MGEPHVITYKWEALELQGQVSLVPQRNLVALRPGAERGVVLWEATVVDCVMPLVAVARQLQEQQRPREKESTTG